MGAFCCCPCADEFDEYPTNSIYRHCLCLRFFVHQLFSGYSTTFHRIEGRPASSSIPGAALAPSGISTVPPDGSFNDTHHPVARPLPYDADQRYSRLQRDGLVSRRDKSMTHFQEDSQPLRRNMSSSGMESLGSGKKRNGADSVEDLKLGHSESSERALATKLAYGQMYIQPSSEDEDVCPTCLDEYTPENPKSQQSALIIFILVVYMNGWKEVIVVRFVARKWNSVKALKSCKKDDLKLTEQNRYRTAETT